MIPKVKTRRKRNSWWVWSWRKGAQQCLGVVEEKTELGRAEFRHEKEGVMPRN